jgi:hypothetical protein
MTPEELLSDIDNCCGPCGDMCLSCPESRYLPEIKQVIEDLMQERDSLRKALELASVLTK